MRKEMDVETESERNREREKERKRKRERERERNKKKRAKATHKQTHRHRQTYRVSDKTHVQTGRSTDRKAHLAQTHNILFGPAIHGYHLQRSS